MKFIESKENSLIKKFRSLSVKKYREQFSLYKLEGEKVVLESLKISGLVENILIDADYTSKYEDIMQRFSEKIIVLKHELFTNLSSTIEPQHIMSICNMPKYTLDASSIKNLLVLDHLQDPGNLGTIIRSAVASGFLDIVLIDSVDPYNDKTIRSASGTIFYPRFYNMSDLEFVEFAKSNGVTIVIAEAGKQSVFDSELKLPQKYALIIGNEGNGVGAIIREQKHLSLSIPMSSKVESLNAGVSASVLMFILSNK